MNIFKKLFGGQKTTEEVKQEKEKDFDMVKYDGVRALRMHQFDLAAKSLEHALQLNAEDLECRDYLSQAYISMGDLQKAYEQLQILSEAQTDNVAVLLRMADVAYMMENYTAMSEVCDKALHLDTSNLQTYLYYAKACRGLGEPIRAVAVLSLAIKLREDYYAARLLRGTILLENHLLDDAAQDADYLFTHLEPNEDVLLLKARVLKAQEKMKEINEAYEQIQKQRRAGSGYGAPRQSYYGTTSNGYSSADPTMQQIRLAIARGDISQAERLLNAVSDHNAEWSFLMGNVCYRRGWLDEAKRYFETACRMDPENPEYRQALAAYFCLPCMF